jgi:hypothetical protein
MRGLACVLTGRTLYGMTFEVQCAGAVSTVRAKPIPLRRRRFASAFSTPSLHGLLRGRVARRARAHG